VLFVRSSIFTFLLFASAILLSGMELLFFWAPFRIKWGIAVTWAKFSLWAGRVFCGLEVTTEGEENIPAEPCVFLIKHTTAMEAYWQIAALPPSAWVLKRELLYVPVFGWALGFVMKSIAVDRRARGSAVRQVIDQGAEKIAAGMSVCIFPEGTRMPPGETRRSCRSRIMRAIFGPSAACASTPAGFGSASDHPLTRATRRRRRPTSWCNSGSRTRWAR
jgi:1-acyl-sn-glycerol-3-phosphate acyltransferase